MIYSIIYSFYKYLLDINREPGLLLGVGATRPRTVKLKAQSPMAGRETVSLGHLGKQRRSINPAPSTVFLGGMTSELSFKGWVRVSQAKQPKGHPRKRGQPEPQHGSGKQFGMCIFPDNLNFSNDDICCALA